MPAVDSEIRDVVDSVANEVESTLCQNHTNASELSESSRSIGSVYNGNLLDYWSNSGRCGQMRTKKVPGRK